MRRVLLAFLGLVLLAGCDGKANATAKETPGPVAENAGGACLLLNFTMVNEPLGTRFEVAAAAQQGETFTCVLQGKGASFPDLVLAVTPTIADAAVFTAKVQPPGATAVPGLGAVAYSAPIAPAGKAGPGVEVGWLAGNSRILQLRLRLAPDAAADQPALVTPKLVEVAKKVDLSSL